MDSSRRQLSHFPVSGDSTPLTTIMRLFEALAKKLYVEGMGVLKEIPQGIEAITRKPIFEAE